MVFIYKKWDDFCKNLSDANRKSIPACEVESDLNEYIVLKHDVETDVTRALELAKIENKYGHRGSYYVQAYLMYERKNIDILRQIQQMGHEVSYHYDVMDSNKGNVENAIIEFEKNRMIFEKKGFRIITVCQHGNPVLERVGYTSNRDFFRNKKVSALYPNIADIMVDFKSKYQTEFMYYSDVGRRFSMIFDPINNDRINSDGRNIKYEDLNEVFDVIKKSKNVILSTHPHRWTKTVFEYMIKNGLFQIIKGTAKMLLHIPGMKKLIGKYYYLAKRI